MKLHKEKSILSLLGVFGLFGLLLVVFINTGEPQSRSSRAQGLPSVINPAISYSPALVTPSAGGVIPGTGSGSPTGTASDICQDPAKICDFDDDDVCMAQDVEEHSKIINMLYTACFVNPQASFGPICSACDQKANRDGVFNAEDIRFCKEYCATVTVVPKPTGVVATRTPIRPTQPSLQPTNIAPQCPTQKNGDCNCSGVTDIDDIECFRKQYVGEATCGSGDCTGDGKCKLADFECIRRNLTF